MGDLATLRCALRAKRRAIVGEMRINSSAAVATRIMRVLPKEAQQIGIFLSMPEEIDTTPLIDTLWSLNKKLFLPKVEAKAKPLLWHRYCAESRLDTDALGMRYAAQGERIEALALDLVIVPLVGFTAQGYRLGMGGGFYDRTFAAKIANAPPFLWGIAYDCQASVFTPSAWDIPLNALFTPTKTLFF